MSDIEEVDGGAVVSSIPSHYTLFRELTLFGECIMLDTFETLAEAEAAATDPELLYVIEFYDETNSTSAIVERIPAL